MNNSSILKDIRQAVGLTMDNKEFDNDLIPHINSSISELNQNGVGRFLVVNSEDQTWSDLIDPEQTEGNNFFPMVPLYIGLNTKLLFDPPPPSNVEYHSSSANKLLWRLKIAYEQQGVR